MLATRNSLRSNNPRPRPKIRMPPVAVVAEVMGPVTKASGKPAPSMSEPCTMRIVPAESKTPYPSTEAKVSAARQPMGDGRNQRLATVSGPEQACYLVDRRAEVIPVSLLGHPGMKRHPDSRVGALIPTFGEECPLGGHGRLQCPPDRGEGCAEGVVERLRDVAAVTLRGFAQDPIVASEGILHLEGTPFPQEGRALYVCE